MSKYLIVFDLDSTLVHSVRNPMYSENNVCVGNNLKGVPTSFMTPTAIEKLDSLLGMDCDILVITSRSLEEYKLLSYSSKIEAYTANGAIRPDGTDREKVNLDEETKHCISSLAKYFDDNNVPYKNVNGKFIQTTSNYKYSDVAEFLKCSDGIEIVYDSKRTFFIPKIYNKGEALLHYLINKNYSCVIACGDSVMDYSMFSIADIVLTCDHSFGKNFTFYFDRKKFTDDMLDTLIEMVVKNYV